MAAPELVSVVRELTTDVLADTARGVRLAWTSQDDLSDEAAEAAVATVVPLVGGAQRIVAGLHASYLARVVDMALVAPEVATLITAATWNRSPVLEARRLVSEGHDFADAIDLAAARAAQVHSGDVLRARNDATTAIGAGVEGIRPVRWAKVPYPNVCSWCREVSTKLYFRPDGLPVHLNDRCGLNAVTPDEAGGYTNASSVFTNYRWRSRVTTQELAAAQRTIAATAADLARTANERMLRAPVAA